MQPFKISRQRAVLKVASLCLLAYSQTQSLAAGPMTVETCSTTSNFKTIQKKCTVIRREILGTKKCKRFGDNMALHCHWVPAPKTIKVGTLRKQTRNPYVTRALKRWQ